MRFYVTVEGVDNAQAFLQKRLGLFDEGLERALNFAAINLAAIAARLAPHDTGALRSSMRHWTIRTKQARIIGLVRMGQGLKYIRYVEFGTRLKRGRKPPPVKPGTPIHGWATRRGLNPYQIGRAISKQGVKAQPFVYRAWEEAMPYVFNAVEQVTRAVYD